jgi:hypothetical protein
MNRPSSTCAAWLVGFALASAAIAACSTDENQLATTADGGKSDTGAPLDATATTDSQTGADAGARDANSPSDAARDSSPVDGSYDASPIDASGDGPPVDAAGDGPRIDARPATCVLDDPASGVLNNCTLQ